MAEHAVHVSNILKDWKQPSIIQLAGLLHDCDEALGLPDLPRPVKSQMPFYKQAGEVVQKAVFAKFGLPYPFPDIIHIADDSVLFLAERPVLMGNRNEKHWQYQGELRPVDVKIMGWSPQQAEIEFRNRYEELWFQMEAAA